MRIYFVVLAVVLLIPGGGFSRTVGASAAQPGTKTEIGVLDGAAYRIDVPNHWNHRLAVYYHGYSQRPVTYKPGPPGKAAAEILARGYAVIQSRYSVTGWALAKAFPETEALREYFVSKYGKPAETYVTEESMGGALTLMTIERLPEYYNCALALCGRLDPSEAARQHQFEMRAAFDYYFPGLLPPSRPGTERLPCDRGAPAKSGVGAGR